MSDMTTNEAKKLIETELIDRGLPFERLTAKTIGFQDLARANCVFVTVHGWRPHPEAAVVEQVARDNGFRVQFKAAKGVSFVS